MTNTNRTFDQEKVVEIIMDMHILTGVTAKRALRAGVSQERVDKIFKISTAMTAMVLSELGVDGDALNRVLLKKIESLQEAFIDEDEDAFIISKADILGVDNDAMA